MAVFSTTNIIQQKWLLDQVNYFDPPNFGMTVLLFTVVFFNKILTFNHLWLLKTKSRKIIPNSKHNKRSFID